MISRKPLSVLIGQERRAIILFLILLLSIIVMIDWIVKSVFMVGVGIELLFPYILLYLLMPITIVLLKNQKLGIIKYLYFSTYIISCIVNELIFFEGNSDYTGGNMAEVFFILFSPIFVNKKYSQIVIMGISVKYLFVGLLLQTSAIFFPLAFMLVLALAAYIILNRFVAYVDALNDSYNKQFETTLSSGMAIVNHTIKNEITKIQYLNNRLKELVSKQDIQEVNPILDSIQQATNHMLNMSNRLQDKTGEIVLQEETHDLNAILNSAIRMIEPYVQKNRVMCIQELNCEVDMRCDQLQLQEALMNILMNAVESMELYGGVMTIRLVKVAKDIIIKIEDNGCGIPSGIRSRVYEPFFTTRSTLNNYGLGLSYSNNVIDKHNGSLEIHSEENVGTMVLIRFPHHRVVIRQKSVKHEVGVLRNGYSGN